MQVNEGGNYGAAPWESMGTPYTFHSTFLEPEIVLRNKVHYYYYYLFILGMNLVSLWKSLDFWLHWKNLGTRSLLSWVC